MCNMSVDVTPLAVQLAPEQAAALQTLVDDQTCCGSVPEGSVCNM